MQINFTIGRVPTWPERQKTPQPIIMLQKESTDAIEMTAEEVQEQIDFEDSAEFLPYAEDSDLLEQEEEQEVTDF